MRHTSHSRIVVLVVVMLRCDGGPPLAPVRLHSAFVRARQELCICSGNCASGGRVLLFSCVGSPLREC